jgi:alpha-glucosidase/alpha-D-xyloside xylohydrolase
MRTKLQSDSISFISGFACWRVGLLEIAFTKPHCAMIGAIPMSGRWNRRQVLQRLVAGSAGLMIPGRAGAAAQAVRPADEDDIEIQIASISEHTVRLSILPVKNGKSIPVASNGWLLPGRGSTPTIIKPGRQTPAQTLKLGGLTLRFSSDPVVFIVATASGEPVQRIGWDRLSGVLSFATGDSPLLGLGEGGPQFDRRGSTDAMVSGQGGYRLATHGARVPIPWIIGTSGWAMFFNQPFGSFDFSGPQSKFLPASPDSALPLDLFFTVARDPAVIMAEYAGLTGHPEMPPLWSFGYQQSHRTLASRQEILAEAQTFREKKLPCDGLIYLSTGFCPSGWNTANGSFVWNSRVFPDPGEMIDELHEGHFKVVLHAVILSDKLRGAARDSCDLSRFDEEQASCQWDEHRKAFALGVDGWWPDEGDPLDIPSRLVRNRMYWDGPQVDRPNERPYALHRNGYAGMQRYASFLWSGDVQSTWETLKTQVPIAINTSLTGIPFWGTDIGGFVPTREFTAELYLRWFQFGAFCTLFRSHGRAWKLRLPWGWNTGDPGPVEMSSAGERVIPEPSQLHDPRVEPICRKYLELRYRLLPYLYSAVRECAMTGMPIMRALWLHFPDDPRAVSRGDQYLFGKYLLVAPVVEMGATSRRIYLPPGDWYDFWTNQPVQGGREIDRAVDLETLPLYVRAGAILPLGPVKQYAAESSMQPLTVSIYPGDDGSFLLYEDDGASFHYRQGEWMGIQMAWHDARRRLTLHLAPGSRVLPPLSRSIEINLGESIRSVVFEGKPIEMTF